MLRKSCRSVEGVAYVCICEQGAAAKGVAIPAGERVYPNRYGVEVPRVQGRGSRVHRIKGMLADPFWKAWEATRSFLDDAAWHKGKCLLDFPQAKYVSNQPLRNFKGNIFSLAPPSRLYNFG